MTWKVNVDFGQHYICAYSAGIPHIAALLQMRKPIGNNLWKPAQSVFEMSAEVAGCSALLLVESN